MLTPAEAATFLRRSTETLRWWRYAGGGPEFFRSGRRVFYLRQALVDWLATLPRDGGY